MKQFVFNLCSVCVNPNVIERTGDNHDEFSISTAEHKGKWGVGNLLFL